ncbi:MAG: hypothetical protein AMXMBFR34_41750 [Myxococcaceae bacterium]
MVRFVDDDGVPTCLVDLRDPPALPVEQIRIDDIEAWGKFHDAIAAFASCALEVALPAKDRHVIAEGAGNGTLGVGSPVIQVPREAVWKQEFICPFRDQRRRHEHEDSERFALAPRPVVLALREERDDGSQCFVGLPKSDSVGENDASGWPPSCELSTRVAAHRELMGSPKREFLHSSHCRSRSWRTNASRDSDHLSGVCFASSSTRVRTLVE